MAEGYTPARVLLRLLPAVLALLLPVLTPGIREGRSHIGAGWLRDDGATYAGRTVWILGFLPQSSPPPSPGDEVEIAQIRDHADDPLDRSLYLHLEVAEDGRTARIREVQVRSEEDHTWFMAQLGLGILLLASLPFFFRPAAGGRVEVRPWIR